MRILQRKINTLRGLLKTSLWKTIYINFHYLPFSQAKHLPIWLYSPQILKYGGKIEIKTNHIYPGMIELGKSVIGLYPKTGITLYFGDKSHAIFHGACSIGNESTVRIHGKIEFRPNVMATYKLELLCNEYIYMGENTLLAWDILVMDCSQHMMKDEKTNQLVGSYTKPIIIKDNVWICSRCIILPGTQLPDKTVLSANSLVCKDYSSLGNYILLGGSPAKLMKQGVWMDRDDCLPKPHH